MTDEQAPDRLTKHPATANPSFYPRLRTLLPAFLINPPPRLHRSREPSLPTKKNMSPVAKIPDPKVMILLGSAVCLVLLAYLLHIAFRVSRVTVARVRESLCSPDPEREALPPSPTHYGTVTEGECNSSPLSLF